MRFCRVVSSLSVLICPKDTAGTIRTSEVHQRQTSTVILKGMYTLSEKLTVLNCSASLLKNGILYKEIIS